MSPRATFNPYVQGGRGLFALSVFVFHMVTSRLPTFGFMSETGLNDALAASEYGVELFFCISGFAISTSLQQQRGLLQFIGDRAIRIYPVLWATLLVMAPLEVVFHKTIDGVTTADVLTSLPANMLALPGVFPLPLIHPAAWSLSYEMVFYVAAASIMIALNRFGSRVAWGLGLAAAVVLCTIYPRALFFLCGVLAVRPGMIRRIPSALLAWPEVWLAIFFWAWHGVQTASPRHIMFYTLIDWAGDRRLMLAVVAFVAAMLGFAGLVQGRGLLGPLLRTRLFLYLGTISYSFYLWHPIVLSILKRLLVSSGVIAAVGSGAQLLFLAISLPLSLAIASASQSILERRLGKWLRAALSARLGRARARAAAPLVSPAAE